MYENALNDSNKLWFKYIFGGGMSGIGLGYLY